MIILGSTSPRRKEILSSFSLPFTVAKPNFDEESLPFLGSPGDYACSIAQGKALSLKNSYPQSIILAADTVVFQKDKVYGKPESEAQACQWLQELVGKWHSVYTGVVVQWGEHCVWQYEKTDVLFHSLTEKQIRHYIAHTSWKDKAGGYSIQLAGGLIVSQIQGCYYNVMGLPINTVATLLQTVQINLWDFL